MGVPKIIMSTLVLFGVLRWRSEMDQDQRKLLVVGGCTLDYNVSSGPFERLLRDF